LVNAKAVAALKILAAFLTVVTVFSVTRPFTCYFANVSINAAVHSALALDHVPARLALVNAIVKDFGRRLWGLDIFE
jgi:hypothetical protein